MYASFFIFLKIFDFLWSFRCQCQERGGTPDLSLDKAPCKAAAKVEAKQLDASEQGVQYLYCSQNEFRFGQEGPRQSWPRNTIDATEKVAPGSFFLSGPQFQFQCALCEKQNQIVQIFVITIFAQKYKKRPKYFKVQIWTLFGENALHFPKMNKSFSLFVEQDPGSSSSPANFEMILFSKNNLDSYKKYFVQLIPEAVLWRRIHQVLSTPWIIQP